MIADRRDGHRHRCLTCGRRHEIRDHQCESVMLAPEIEFLSRLPAAPNGPQSIHIFPQARHRRRPRHGEAFFIVRPNLRSQSQDKPSLARDLQIPAGIGDDHGTARKRDGDCRPQHDLLGCHGGDTEREKRIVPVLHRADHIEPGILRRLGGRRYFIQVVLGKSL